MGARAVARRVGAVRRRPRSIRTPARCSRAIRGTRSSARASPSPTWRGRQTRWTGDRARVHRPQRRRSPIAGGARPARRRCPARSGAGLDPCGALQTTVELPPSGRRRDRLLPRRGRRARARRATLDRALPRGRSRRGAVARSARHWDDVLGAVQVKTPDRAMDIMLNGWLLYQTLACRIWARSALLPGQRRLRLPRPAAGRHGARRRRSPAMTREHLLRAAAPPVRRGRRPALVAAAFGPGRAHADLRRPALAAYAVAHYVERDRRRRRSRRGGPLPRRASAAARRARQLLPARRSRTRSASLFEHCARGARRQPGASAPTACR